MAVCAPLRSQKKKKKSRKWERRCFFQLIEAIRKQTTQCISTGVEKSFYAVAEQKMLHGFSTFTPTSPHMHTYKLTYFSHVALVSCHVSQSPLRHKATWQCPLVDTGAYDQRACSHLSWSHTVTERTSNHRFLGVAQTHHFASNFGAAAHPPAAWR